MQVPLPGAAVGLGHPGPGRAAELRDPVVRRQFAARAAPVAEDEPGSFRAAGRRGQRGAEQRMRAGAVVGHQVDDDPDLVRGRVLDQMVEVGHGPEQRVHGAVIADVIPAVGQRGRVERGQPDGVDAEVGQVPQAGPQPRQVTHAVAIRVGEAARVHLVDDRVLPPHPPAVAHAPPSSRRSPASYGTGAALHRRGGLLSPGPAPPDAVGPAGTVGSTRRRLGTWWSPRSSKPVSAAPRRWRVRFPSASARDGRMGPWSLVGRSSCLV